MLAPWTIYASSEEGRFIPVTKGSAAALFVGTYLPGGGTTIGMKEHLEPQLRAEHPGVRRAEDLQDPRGRRARAVRRQASGPPARRRAQQGGQEEPDPLLDDPARGLREDAVGQGQADVVLLLPRRRRALHLDARCGSGRSCSSLAAGLGLLAGLIRRRDGLLGAALLTIAFSTGIHTIVVSQARYNVPLMPLLIATGVAGWFLALRRPEPSPASERPTAELRPVDRPRPDAGAMSWLTRKTLSGS